LLTGDDDRAQRSKQQISHRPVNSKRRSGQPPA
jgi:hypothetical protein